MPAAPPQIRARAGRRGGVDCRAQRWDPTDVLRSLLAAEAQGRDRSTIEVRRKRAHFPAGKTFDTWEESRSSIPPNAQRSLRSLEWIGRRENLVVAGPSGTGKSHLLEALGHAAIDVQMTVAWFSVEDLGALVRRHRVDDTVSKVFASLASVALVVVDDIGLLPSLQMQPKASIAWSTPLTNVVRWLCRPICIPLASTSSWTRPSPQLSLTGSCTMPTSSSPKVNRSA